MYLLIYLPIKYKQAVLALPIPIYMSILLHTTPSKLLNLFENLKTIGLLNG